MIGLLGCIKSCASNSLNDEYQPEILGSPNLERTERTKGRRNPRIFWGVSFSELDYIFIYNVLQSYFSKYHLFISWNVCRQQQLLQVLFQQQQRVTLLPLVHLGLVQEKRKGHWCWMTPSKGQHMIYKQAQNMHWDSNLLAPFVCFTVAVWTEKQFIPLLPHPRPGVPWVSKNLQEYFTYKTVEVLR